MWATVPTVVSLTATSPSSRNQQAAATPSRPSSHGTRRTHPPRPGRVSCSRPARTPAAVASASTDVPKAAGAANRDARSAAGVVSPTGPTVSMSRCAQAHPAADPTASTPRVSNTALPARAPGPTPRAESIVSSPRRRSTQKAPAARATRSPVRAPAVASGTTVPVSADPTRSARPRSCASEVSKRVPYDFGANGLSGACDRTVSRAHCRTASTAGRAEAVVSPAVSTPSSMRLPAPAAVLPSSSASRGTSPTGCTGVSWSGSPR